jgi:pyridoxamine 5'-phosphate oxidase
MNHEDLQNLRKEYSAASLSETTTKGDPIKQFELWFNEALESKQHEPNAMTLATATYDGRPSARIVLLKGFFWGELERQVRIEGNIEKLSKEESEKYFHSRPKGSQVGAVASPQSQEIASRDELEKKWQQLETEYDAKEVPKPSYWGGYILKPRMIEFWQGRPSRLHDRILYKKIDNKNWKKVRLAP